MKTASVQPLRNACCSAYESLEQHCVNVFHFVRVGTAFLYELLGKHEIALPSAGIKHMN